VVNTTNLILCNNEEQEMQMMTGSWASYWRKKKEICNYI